MKLLIASDIHGSATYCRKLINRIEEENSDKVLLLGDLLYHGPRNDLPLGYAPKEVIKLLETLKDKLICVRGNCDTEVDQMVLPFPMLADYGVIFIDGVTLYATHGHIYNQNNLPPLSKGDVIICGHTHVPKIEKAEDFTYINVGSVSIPKENTPHSYVILENGVFVWKDLEGNVYKKASV